MFDTENEKLQYVTKALAAYTPAERAEFAVRIGVSERTVYRWATGGKIDPLKLDALTRAVQFGTPAQRERLAKAAVDYGRQRRKR